MCELCDNKTRDIAREGHAYRADMLERLAAVERQIANGRILPHSPQMKDQASLAHMLIRYLVEDWL